MGLVYALIYKTPDLPELFPQSVCSVKRLMHSLGKPDQRDQRRLDCREGGNGRLMC